MSAEVIVLPVVYDPQRLMTRSEMLRERVTDARCRVVARTLRKSPIVLARRSTLAQRERSAFELGRECAQYLGR